MSEGKRELPPLHALPRRELSAPARKSISGTFALDGDTPTRNPTATEWRRLAEVFELLSPDRRADLAELGHLLRRLTPERRAQLLDMAIEMNGLG
jgi:hypothetical protein